MIKVHKFIVGVMGGGEGVSRKTAEMAYQLGKLLANEGWVLLCGGRAAGVMEASAKGAKEAGGLTVGILPGRDKSMASRYIDIAICTGMGDGRNYINVLSSDIVVALPGRAGTISEIALALKSGKKVILLDFDTGDLFDYYRSEGLLWSVKTPEEAIRLIKEYHVSKYNSPA
ncbi:MAG TPA: TIGR00725 family protein [Syntrophomonadaceae bacterium]|nr:TIGR00725 family protein [Syntrophomonadaceae bacterium]